MPSNNYGNQALYFRKTELTGTKISSMVKAELFVFPVTILAMIVFSIPVSMKHADQPGPRSAIRTNRGVTCQFGDSLTKAS